MANQFQIKRSSVPGKVPDAANVAVGELAVNLVDQRLYTKDGSGNIFLLGAGNTDRLTEGTANLFYSNSRVDSYVTPKLTTANVVETTNLYYTNTRVYANISPLLTTANVAEVNNLYYTNARVRSALSGGTGVTYNASTGQISIGQNVSAVDSPTFFNLTISGNLSVVGNTTTINSTSFEVDDPLIYLAGNNYSSDLVDIGFVGNYYDGNLQRHAGLFRDATDGNFKLFANLNPEPSAVIDTANSTFRYANLYVDYLYGNVIGTVSTLSNFSTSNLAEGTNLYYTNARVYSNISPLLTTANVSEVNNLYYTNARVYSNVISLLPNYTGNIGGNLIGTGSNTTIIAGSYSYSFLNTGESQVPNLRANIIYANVIQGVTTTSIAEGSNLYYTNARVYSNVSPLLALKANVSDLTTSNVTEGTNLYYTNARVDSYVTPKLTTANVVETSNLYFTNARVIAALVGQDVILDDLTVQGDLTVNGNVTTLNTATLVVEDKNIVLANGSVNAAAADGAGITIYGANANIKYLSASDRFDINKNLLVLGNVVLTTGSTTSDLPEGANLYYTNARARSAISAGTGVSYNSTTGVISADNANSFLIGRLFAGEFIGNNTTTNFNLNFNPQSANAVLLFVDSILQTPDVDYTLTAPNVIVFTSAPEANANIVYRHFSSTNIDLNLGNLGDVASYLTATANSILVYNGTLWEPRDYSFLANTSYIVEGANLYYTNARARSSISVTGSGSYDQANGIITVTGGVTSVNGANGNVTLTTTNVAEGANLYYTNARVRSAISVTGSGSYDQANGIITVTGGVTSVNGANGAVVLTTANVSENSNLYYTNARVYANISPLLTTANVSEVTNLYYTNARVYSAVAGNLTLKANVSDLTTANVTELTNLYYTNSRVYSNVISLLPNYTGNVGGNIVGINGNTTIVSGGYLFNFLNTGEAQVPTLRANILYANIIQGATTSNITEGTNLYYTNARVYSAITGNLVLKSNVSDLTTANVVELTNLYYTNARVYSNVIGLLNTKANVSDLTTANVAELTNLYYTNARVYSNVIGLLNTKANVSDLTTSNVTEGTNLYYTNARVYANTTALLATGVTLGNVIITGNLTIQGNTTIVNSEEIFLADNQIVLNSNHSGAPTQDAGLIVNRGSSSNVALSWNESTDRWTFTNDGITYYNLPTSTSDVTEGTNLYYTNARVYSAITGNLALKSNVADLTTANVVELTNLYYTNARVYSNVISLLPNYSGNIGGNIVGTDSNTLIIAGNYTYSFLNTGEVQVPNVRANILYANIIQGASTSNIAEGSNLYYTNARVYSAITGNLVLKANVSDLTTSNVVEGANLYYTNARVDARIALANIRDLLDVSSNTPSLGQSLVWTGSIWHPETITGGGGGGGSNIILVGEQTSAFFYGDNTTTNFNLGFNPYNDNNIMVFVDGINQISPNNYTVSGQTLIFDEAPATNTVVAVRYFAANSVYNTKFFLGTATNQEFVGDGSNVNFQISGIAGDSNQTFVFVNGVIQQPSYNYSITNSTLTFTSAPDSGANIFVRTFSNSQNELDLGQLKNVSNTAPATGQALTWTGNVWAPATLNSNVAAYQKYRYTANASQTVFTGADDSTQILVIPSTQRMQVHLNGVMLEPTLDYTANGSAVTLVLGAEAGDILSVGTFVDLGQGFAVDSFTANGSNTNFSLSRVPNGGASLLVSLNGLKQHQTEFTISGTTLSFNNAPPANTAIEVTHMGNAPIATVIEQWAEISGNATAAPGYKYIVNTSAVPAFINMPPNPRLGDTVYFLDGTSSFDTRKLTLLRNGSKIMGQNDNFESDIEDSYFGFVYFNTTYGWRLLN